MHHIRHWPVLLLVLLFLLSSSARFSAASNATQLNVIFVMFDDLRPAIGGYGDRLAQTPHLDYLMRQSHYFTRAYSQQALCAPSRNSLLTSRRPDTLRLYDFYNYWRTWAGNFTTLPQYFKEHGYYTYGAGKIFHPGISSNNSDDFPLSWSARPFRPRTEKFMNSPVCPNREAGAGGDPVLRKNLICPVELQTQPFKTLPDIESVTEAIRFLEARQHSRRPFFLALGFHKPHINFRFPRQFLDRFKLNDFFNYTQDASKPIDMPNVAWNPYTDVRSRDDFKHMNISFPYGPISPLQSAQIRQAYYASVAYVDDLFGKFMAHVNRTNTIVLVTSDHGWSLGEHAEWAKYSNFEVALRVPLIISSPELSVEPEATVRRIHTLAELVDIFPTLVDLAHLPRLEPCDRSLPANMQLNCTEGKSLYPQLMGAGLGEEHIALSQYPRPGMQPTKHPNSDKPKLRNIKVMGYSLRTDNYRYTAWVRYHANNFTRDWTTIYGEEMYDHRLDPDEEMNLVELPEFEEVRQLLHRRLIAAFDR